MNLFVYPQHKKNQTDNPYVNNMEESFYDCFDVVHKEYRFHFPQPLRLLLGSTKAEVYVLNWIEDAAEGGGNKFLRVFMTIFAIRVILLRKAKIVWIYHNIHPHAGETKWSETIKKILFKRATLIISHSEGAADYARRFAKCPVYFRSHPVCTKNYGEWSGEVKNCDYYVWGNVYPYKGVLELVSNSLCKSSRRKILIVGKCDDESLSDKIKKQCNENVLYENRCACFEEIAAQSRKAKYVLFPYIGDSVSSSGVLMDTLMMGGTPVGPNRGAFTDLAAQGCCLTYNRLEEVFELPIGEDNAIKLNKESVNQFIEYNSWKSFANWLLGKLE